jgi:glutathione peroxidase
MFEKIDVKGKNIHPLYKYLTEETDFKGTISWNFNKFLVDRQGKVIARWGSKIKPESPEISTAIEKALNP